MLENITRREKLKGTDPPATKQAHPTISPEIVRSLVIILQQHILWSCLIILWYYPTNYDSDDVMFSLCHVGWMTVTSQNGAVKRWPQLSPPQSLQSWTWVTTTWGILAWICSLLDWGTHSANWRHWGMYLRSTSAISKVIIAQCICLVD